MASHGNDPLIQRIQAGTNCALQITTGEPFQDSDYEVLIGGVPDRAHFEASAKLSTFIIPFTGIPNKTRELLLTPENKLAFPHVSVHNLHHSARPVAEHAVSMMLACAKNLIPVHNALRNHNWRPRYEDHSSIVLQGKNALILGFGHIGQQIAKMCKALGMNAKAVRRQVRQVEEQGISLYGMDKLYELLPSSHVVFVCLPLTEKTKGLIDKTFLQKLPDRAIVVNIGRGLVIDEQALYNELASGRISAGLDVWYQYPKSTEDWTNTPVSELPFNELPNIVMSPHSAAHSVDTEQLRANELARLLNAYSNGEDVPNKVNLVEGY